jgi:hypothetical protein
MTAFGFAKEILSADLIENGAFCHFRDPTTDEPLYRPGAIDPETGNIDESKRVGAYVRSVNSKVYEEFLDRVTRKAMSQNRRAKNEAQKQEVVFQQLKAERPENFSVLVTRLVNTDPERVGEIVPTHEEKVAIVKDPHNSPFVDQVINFAQDPANYGVADEAPKGNADAA